MFTDPDDSRPTVPALRPRAEDLLPGQVLSDTYRVVRPLAEGGMGAVYEAVQVRLGRRVAIKVLRGTLHRHPEAWARFRREAETVSRLQNPHIVQVFDFHETDRGPYFVMEYLEGESLAVHLERETHLAMAEALGIASQIASGLASAHQEGVAHRDLKPDNIFLVAVPSEPLFVKILDFGIATARIGQARITQDHALLGTPEYMAPEQAAGLPGVDHRADQFALAVLLYEMASGGTPFHGEDTADTLDRIVNGAFTPLSKVAPWVPVGFDTVLARALSKDPTARYASISQFAWALENAARDANVARSDRASGPGRYTLAPSAAPSEDAAPQRRSLSPNAAPDAERERFHVRAARLRDEASSALQAGALDDAVFAAERLMDLAVHHRDLEMYQLVGRAIPTLDRIFEARVGPQSTRLEVAPLDPRRLNLAPNAARLLEHIDGGATVAEVLSQTGIPHRDAIRMLAGLLRRGAIRTVA